jgi:hypothetical protein
MFNIFKTYNICLYFLDSLGNTPDIGDIQRQKGVMLLYVTGFNDLVLLTSLTNTGKLLDS